MLFLEPAAARAARAYTGLGQIELARAAGVASRTVFKLEKDGWVNKASLERILEALEGFGVTMAYDERGRVAGIFFRDTAPPGEHRS